MLVVLTATVLDALYEAVLGFVVRWLLRAPVGAVRTMITGGFGFFVILPARWSTAESPRRDRLVASGRAMGRLPAAYGGRMNHRLTPAPSTPSPHRRLGFSFLALVALAALAVPRVILHDLHVIAQNDILNWVLALGPMAIWIAATVVKKVPNPFLTVLTIGVIFGVMLVITHQLLWDSAFQGDQPAIGDGPGAVVIPRIAAVFSGMFTSALTGAVCGLIAWGIQVATKRTKH